MLQAFDAAEIRHAGVDEVPFWVKTRDLAQAAISPKTLPVLRRRGERQLVEALVVG